MSTDCLPYEGIPHTSHLFAEYTSNHHSVREFYPRSPFSKEWLAEEARAVRYDDERRRRVADILERQNRAWGASPAALESLGRFRAGAAAVVTGQQVGLFGGPLFSVYKALTAIRLAVEASQAGADCVPIFWLATEDHDLAEVNHVTLLNAEGELERIATPSHGDENAPVGSIRLGAEIEDAVRAAGRILGESEAYEFLKESYRPGETLGGAFARLFSRLFRDSGIVLVDASDPELHRIAEPVLRAAALAAADLDGALLARNKALEARGFHAQVKVTPESTLLFQLQQGARLPVHRANAGFQAGRQKMSQDELLRRISDHPEEFSANVLLRPVVEDYLLPTVAYVGGPAEVAYFAQAAVVYEELLGRVTTVVPRFSATLIEPRIQRLLDRYQVCLPDTFHGSEHLQEVLAKRCIPPDLAAHFDSASQTLAGSLDGISDSLKQLDPTLVNAATKARSKMTHQLERLRGRAARAQLRRNQEISRHAGQLMSSLYPHKGLQEREVGGITYLARYGTGLLLRLYDAAQLNCGGHQLINL
ncbi:MAG TPA: bacillithiol biosynthesis cysteine-adding enzyme BshC [Terriglobales bacterium]|nr:bacillithiol biosynthesis cysteine-adding enzyme BshC [Terriglobales bacterium]